MTPSPEFRKLCRAFHQDIGLVHASADAAITFALSCLTPSEQAAVKKFLAAALREPIDGAALLKMWSSSPAEIFFTKEEGLINFLRLIQKGLD